MNNLKPETNTPPEKLQVPAEAPSRVEPTETADVEATRKIAAARSIFFGKGRSQ